MRAKAGRVQRQNLQEATPTGRPAPVQAKSRSPRMPDSTAGSARTGPGFGDIPLFPQDVRADDGGTQLPQKLRQRMEAAFNADFSGVRIHQGPEPESLSALAFTQGRDIHFAPGQYNPSTGEGQRIIGHELAHVMQQQAGRVPTPQGRGLPVVHSPQLEAEADDLGDRAVQGQPVSLSEVGGASGSNASAASAAPIQGKSGSSSSSGSSPSRSSSMASRILEEVKESLPSAMADAAAGNSIPSITRSTAQSLQSGASAEEALDKIDPTHFGLG